MEVISKISILFLMSLFLSGCGNLKAVPYPTHFNSLDEKSVNYIRNSPSLDLSTLEEQKNRENQTLKEKEILVSVSGGGARAAAYTLGILAELENLSQWVEIEDESNPLQEIDYFSTVSGGGWGVSAYLANKIIHDSPDYSLNSQLESIKHDFLVFSSNSIECLPKALDNNITKGIKLSNIFQQQEGALKYPYFFINSTIYSNQSPFVFTKEFYDYYRVKEFTACKGNETHEIDTNFYDLPLSFAVATSGSVPGFYHNYASTNICAESSDLFDSFFCSNGKASYDKLILVDGGIYDNYGYQTALEILSKLESSKLIIVIDSNADTEIPFENKEKLSKAKVGFGSLLKAGFPARTSAYNRMFKMTADAMGADVITLDFFSVSDIERKSTDLDINSLLKDLDLLRNHARNEVYCFDENGKYLKSENEIIEKGNSEDCTSNNYYRSGLMGKTTYLFDDYYFSLLVELGRFTVRVNAKEIAKKMYNIE